MGVAKSILSTVPQDGDARSANRLAASIHLTFAVESILGMKTVLLEPKMQNTKDNSLRNQPEQDNRPNVAEQCHESSAKIVGESFAVNENDVRDRDRPDTEAGQACHKESAKVAGESFDVNENDVRDQDRPDS
jgi:hypothetical protein